MITIYDRYGVQQSWDWLVEHYGPLVIHPADEGPGWRVVEIWENGDPVPVEGIDSGKGRFLGIEAAPIIMVQCRRANGMPAPGVAVAWYWPDAPENANAGPANGLPVGMRPGRADGPGHTDGNGNTGFAMGRGAYYFPPEIGPHAVWVWGTETNSDVVFGLGMIGGTNHDSLWLVYQYGDDGQPPEPPPPPPVDPIMEQVEIARGALDRIEALLAC